MKNPVPLIKPTKACQRAKACSKTFPRRGSEWIDL